jgi:hypothetical protein
MTLNTCDGCGKGVPDHETTHFGSQDAGYRLLCGQCFNKEVASLHGMEEFEQIQFEPIGLTDCDGEMHEFHFQHACWGISFHWKPLSWKMEILRATSSK